MPTRRHFLKAAAALASAPSLAHASLAQRPATAEDGGALEAAWRQPIPAGQRLLLKGGTIVSLDDKVGDFATGDLLIEGKRIAAVGADLKARANTQIIDASNTIVIPGFVDSHRHSWEGQLR